MKIAITSSGKDLNSAVDPRFGRAEFFIIYDTTDESFSVVDNQQNLNARQGAGIQSGQTIVNTGATALLTGNCGPKAFNVLSAAGIKVYLGAKGTIQDTITAYQAGELTTTSTPNKEGHWM
jgi:predicted Fe-Mo cluster-binding NifX family protein